MAQTENTSRRSTHDIARQKLQSLAKESIEFRLLNALLTCAPTLEGAIVVANDITDASEEPYGFRQLAEFYKRGLLIPMRAGGQTPQVSFHHSRDPEIKTLAKEIAIDLETATRDQSMLRKYTLQRDGYRCAVTRQWDLSSLRLDQVKDEFNPSTDYSTPTVTAHILPFSLMTVDIHTKLFNKSTIWAVIKSFTNVEFTELNGQIINSLTNVITLDGNVHTLFGQLHVWFEAMPGQSNVYKIRKAAMHILRDVDDGSEVTFTSPDPETLPLPDPRYLAFHAAVAKVVHMAGMAEHLEDIIKNYETIRVLSNEPSVEYLDGLLVAAQRSIAEYS